MKFCCWSKHSNLHTNQWTLQARCRRLDQLDKQWLHVDQRHKLYMATRRQACLRTSQRSDTCLNISQDTADITKSVTICIFDFKFLRCFCFMFHSILLTVLVYWLLCFIFFFYLYVWIAVLLFWRNKENISPMGDWRSTSLEWPWPWPWFRPYGIPSCITHRPLRTYQISLRSEEKFFWKSPLRFWSSSESRDTKTRTNIKNTARSNLDIVH